MKRISLLFLIVVLFISMYDTLPAQTGSITGVIKDVKTGEILPGARIELTREKETNAFFGAISKRDGKFSIRGVKPGTYNVVAHYVGYKKYKKKIAIAADEAKTMNIGMIPDVIGLDQIVVTGVASRTRKDVADVSVARIDAADLQEKNVYQDLTQMLAGKVSGVQIQNSSGNVGGGIRFQVRGGGGLNGTGQPVIFVDGARINNDEVGVDIGGQNFGTLSDLNPEDIESIEMLKGPAGAALYGTSGSNGVVLITTKRGRGAQDYVRFNYKSIFGWNEQAVEYDEANVVTAADANNIFREGAINENTFSVEGRSGVFSYFAAYSKRDEEGIVLQNEFNRESVRANFEVFPTKELNIRVSGNYVWKQNDNPINDNNVTGWLGNVLLFTQSYRFTDSAAIAAIQNGLNTNRFIGSAEMNYSPDWLPGLRLHGLVGFDGMDYKNQLFYSPEFFYTGPGMDGEKQIFQRIREQQNYDLNLSYSYNIPWMEGLSASSTIGTQLFSNKTTFSDVTVQGFVTPKINNLNAGETFISSDDGLFHFREAGIYLHQDFNLNDTYLLTIAARNDYSSVVGVIGDPPSIWYPRISGAVRIDRMTKLPDFISMLKLRAGYGQSGQLPGSLAAFPLRWAGGQTGFGVGGVMSSIGNPDIEPERIQEIEFGIEFEALDAYGIDFTYFLQFANESIIPFPNPPSTGLTASTVATNIGEIKTWGFETTIYASPIISRDYQLDFMANISMADNEIISLGTDQPIIGGFGNQGWYEGERRAAFMVPKVNGALFDSETGEYLAPDVGTENEYAGTPIPTFFGSFSTSFRFLKHFTFSFMFEFATGHSIYNNTRAFQVSFGNDVEYNTLSADLGTQTPGTAEYNATAEKIARLNPNYDANFIEEADFMRLRELSLRCDLTEWLEFFLKDTYVKRLTLVASVRNVALWTKYGGIDPEVNMFGSRDNLSRGVDFLTLQNPRVYNFTVSIGL